MSESTKDENDEAEQPTRRDLLTRAAMTTTVGTLAFAGIGIIRMPKPGVMPGRSAAFKIGSPGGFPVSDQPVAIPGRNLFIVHHADGFSAISAICTHLGCVVAPSTTGYECPCHGSKFGKEGSLVQGPAGSPLPWFEMSQAPDGQLVVHTDRTVKMGTRSKFA